MAADHSLTLRLGFAVAVTMVACAVRIAFDRWVNADLLALLSFSAVLASTMRGGVGPGILSTLLVTAVERVLDRTPTSYVISPAVINILVEGLLLSLLGG